MVRSVVKLISKGEVDEGPNFDMLTKPLVVNINEYKIMSFLVFEKENQFGLRRLSILNLNSLL